MSRQPVVLLTRDGVELRYVARVLIERFPELQVMVETGLRGGKPAALRRARRAGSGIFAGKIARALYHKLIGDYYARRRALIRFLGEPSLAQPIFEQAVTVNTVNDEDAVAYLRQRRPALVLVYGTGVVRSPVFNAIECTILNLHTGLSPYYRGFDSHIWALVDDRLDRVGVTVHECTPDIDGGSILATGTVAVQPGDTMHDVFARQVLEGAPLYARCAAAELDTPMSRTVQNLALGREYRWVEMDLWTELAARRRLRRLRREG